MKKRKIYEISVIDKTYSKTISDETKFYTSDTALELGFELKETEYDFESAEIVLLNIDDRSLVTRPVTKRLDSFVYELDDDTIIHYGEWRGQLRFEQAGEIYVSSPIKFRVENDLSNERPPQLSDVQSWVSLKRYTDSLIEELKQAVLGIEGIEDTFNANEIARQTTFETNESKRDGTFSTNEATRQENESARQQAESQRQSDELIRTENEKKRNLTSVDEFIKLQDAVGGRNYILNSQSWDSMNYIQNKMRVNTVTTSIPENLNGNVIEVGSLESDVGYLRIPFEVTEIGKYTFTIYVKRSIAGNGIGFKVNVNEPTTEEGSVRYIASSVWGKFVITKDIPTTGVGYVEFRPDRFTWADTARYYLFNPKLEKGTQSTPHTKAPEDYSVVSKDDYYEHIELMNEFKDNQFMQLKQAVIALGGTI